MTLADRFWAKVDRSGGPDACWPWSNLHLSPTPGRAYGSVSVNGRARRAHVVAWELVNGVPFPEGRYGCHTCDHPWCVNPAHIYPGTPKDNARDVTERHPERRYRGGPQPGAFRRHICARGIHAMTPDNIYVLPKGGDLLCRACKRENWARYSGHRKPRIRHGYHPEASNV